MLRSPVDMMHMTLIGWEYFLGSMIDVLCVRSPKEKKNSARGTRLSFKGQKQEPTRIHKTALTTSMKTDIEREFLIDMRDA